MPRETLVPHPPWLWCAAGCCDARIESPGRVRLKCHRLALPDDDFSACGLYRHWPVGKTGLQHQRWERMFTTDGMWPFVPRQAQCDACRRKAAYLGCARDEHIIAVADIFLTGLAEVMARPGWERESVKHGTEGNPHVWLRCDVPCYVGTPGTGISVKSRQCPCGLYEWEQRKPGPLEYRREPLNCEDRACQRERGHPGLHMSRHLGESNAEIVDEWGSDRQSPG